MGGHVSHISAAQSVWIVGYHYCPTIEKIKGARRVAAEIDSRVTVPIPISDVTSKVVIISVTDSFIVSPGCEAPI